ncbi:hypothetical protein [Streptomyces sp. NPDC056069]|uniref:hypothetical protein n=1 Tax=Streptomyces sp. NPDC056069 TaxID=3345702 RepID=UPI0035DDDC0B
MPSLPSSVRGPACGLSGDVGVEGEEDWAGFVGFSFMQGKELFKRLDQARWPSNLILYVR